MEYIECQGFPCSFHGLLVYYVLNSVDLWTVKWISEVIRRDLFSAMALFSNPLNDPFLLTKGAAISLNQLSTQAAIVKCVIAHASYNWTVFGAIGSRLALQ